MTTSVSTVHSRFQNCADNEVQFRSLTHALGPTLRSLRQKEFYDDPRFHVSIAWALLDGAQGHPSASPSSEASPAPTTAPSPGTEEKPLLLTPTAQPARDISAAERSTAAFPTIPAFPPSLVPRLQEQFRPELVLPQVGGFEAEEVHVRIGKEIRRWRLG